MKKSGFSGRASVEQPTNLNEEKALIQSNSFWNRWILCISFSFSDGAMNMSGMTAVKGDSFAIRQLRQRVSDCTSAKYYYYIIRYQWLN